MSARFAIFDAKDTTLRLGAGAWTRERRHALSFVHEADAYAHIAELRRQGVKMAARDFAVRPEPAADDEQIFGMSVVTSDYDPFGLEVGGRG